MEDGKDFCPLCNYLIILVKINSGGGEDLEQWGKHLTAKEGHHSLFAGIYWDSRALLVAQMVKNLFAMQETWIQSPG